EGIFTLPEDENFAEQPYRMQMRFLSTSEVRLSVSRLEDGAWIVKDQDIAATVTAMRCPGCYRFDADGSEGPIQITAMYLPTGFAGTPPPQISISYGASETLVLTDMRYERGAGTEGEPEGGPTGLEALGGMKGEFTLSGPGISPAARGVGEGEDYSLYLKFVSASRAQLDIAYGDDRGYAEREIEMRVIPLR